jgi:[acyl-carrier-protein] S-malonyltransferase
MGRALAEQFPVCRETFAEADDALREALSALVFEGPADRLTLTENTQPALLATSVAVWRLLASRGHAPAFMAGHSLGEYSAHVAAGTLGFADALRLVRHRGRYMQEAVPPGDGAMAALLGIDEAGARLACEEAAEGQVVSCANLNAPGQIVIAGHAAAVQRASERARAHGAKRAIPLNVSAPFHCALMLPAQERLAPELRAVPAHAPRVPVVANVDAEPKRDGPGAIAALIAQVSAPVRWVEVVQRLSADGVTTFVEVGPGTVLSGLVKKIARDATIVNVQGPDDLAAVDGLLMTQGGTA